jgi:hypothetical protein
LTGSRRSIIPLNLPHAEIRDALIPLIGGTDKGTFIPVTFAKMPKAREAVEVRYKQLVANFPVDREAIDPRTGLYAVAGRPASLV